MCQLGLRVSPNTSDSAPLPRRFERGRIVWARFIALLSSESIAFHANHVPSYHAEGRSRPIRG